MKWLEKFKLGITITFGRKKRGNTNVAEEVYKSETAGDFDRRLIGLARLLWVRRSAGSPDKPH